MADKSLARYMSLGLNIDPRAVGVALDELILAYFLSIVHSPTIEYLYNSSIASNKKLPIEEPGSYDPQEFLSRLEEVVSRIAVSSDDTHFSIDPKVLSFLRKNLVGINDMPACYDVSVFKLVTHPDYWSN
jgi:hypothetical protein